MEYFEKDEIAAVRTCFGPALPAPIVERVMDLRIERCEGTDCNGQKYFVFYKDSKKHGKCEKWDRNGVKVFEGQYQNGKRNGTWQWWYKDKGHNCSHYMEHYRLGKKEWERYNFVAAGSNN